MGAPKNEVMELMGKVPCVPGSWESKSHESIMIAPSNGHAGMSVR